jgi:HD-GYP domain-containing protein (c-di-GMP phosphodiesterase class II)
MVNGWEQGIVEAQKELQAETDRLPEIWRQLLAENTRLSEVNKTLEAENARLSEAEQQLSDEVMRLSEDKQQFQDENATLQEIMKELREENARLSTARRQPERHAPAPEVSTPPRTKAKAAQESPRRAPVADAVEGVDPSLVQRAIALMHGQGDATDETLALTLSRTLDARCARGAGFSERMARWVDPVARMLGCREEVIGEIRLAALLHDIGKLAVPATSVPTSTRLAAEERAARLEPVVAEKILETVEGMEGVAVLLRHQYERWDGTGYPDELRGDAIPMGARILPVAEDYGDMTSGRRGMVKLHHLDAVAELRRCAGTQFDPRVVDVFCRLVRESGEV